MFEIPPEKEEQVSKALEWSWIMGLGALVLLIGFVLLLFKMSPSPLGN